MTPEIKLNPEKLSGGYRLSTTSSSVDRVVRVYGIRGDDPDDVLRARPAEPLRNNEWFPDGSRSPVEVPLHKFFEDRVEAAPRKHQVRELRDDGEELSEDEVHEIHVEWLDDWERTMVRKRIVDEVEIRGETYEVVEDGGGSTEP